jgi:hypothetical protein
MCTAVIVFPVPSRDVTYQTLYGRKLLNYSRLGRVWLVTSRLGAGKIIIFFKVYLNHEVNENALLYGRENKVKAIRPKMNIKYGFLRSMCYLIESVLEGCWGGRVTVHVWEWSEVPLCTPAAPLKGLSYEIDFENVDEN